MYIMDSKTKLLMRQKHNKPSQEYKNFIPGGTSPYSKSMDVFPKNIPNYIKMAKYCYVIGSDDIRYLDWGMNVRSVILGYCDETVDNAAKKAIDGGIGFTRPSRYENELSDLLRSIIPCAEMVKFGKNGSDATSGAVKLARAYTKRNKVLVAQENPFISQHDWFMGITPVNDGTDTGGNNTEKYSYEDIYNTLPDDAGFYDNVACIILDPATVEICKYKLEYIRKICSKYNVIMILDEIISGFRFGVSGVQGLYGVTPDLATFGKAMANGYSISALCGKKELMQLGDRKFGDVFLMSGTYFGETTGLAAAIATIKILCDKNPLALYNIGNRLIEEFNKILLRKKIEWLKFYGSGYSPSFKCTNIVYKTLLDSHMVKRGIMMPYIAPSYSHGEIELLTTINVFERAMELVRCITIHDSTEKVLSVIRHSEKPVFRKLEVVNDN